MEDLIIIGAGPAGLTAGLYASRASLKTVLLERLSPGGQVITTDKVDNYPGFPDGVSGFELVDRMKRQAEKFGLKIQSNEVVQLQLSSQKKFIITDKETYEAKAIILACGADHRKLDIEGEDHFTGKGVSYCATCDGPFYRDQEVAVIGGGDTAVEEALFLTRFVKRVYLIHRRDELRATKLLQNMVKAEEKITLVWDSIPIKISGVNGVEGLDIKNVITGEETHIILQGVFVFIGYTPNNKLVNKQLKLDQKGFIITDNNMETSVPGVFAAGDIRSKILRQISTAVGDGATAAFTAEKYLKIP